MGTIQAGMQKNDGEQPGFLLVDHGSRRTLSNQQLEAMAAMLQQRYPDIPCIAAHMEIAQPDIATAARRLISAGVNHIHVLCYFLSNGRHISDDIPQLVKEALAEEPSCSYDIASALGPDELLADLLIKRSPFSNGATGNA